MEHFRISESVPENLRLPGVRPKRGQNKCPWLNFLTPSYTLQNLEQYPFLDGDDVSCGMVHSGKIHIALV